MFMGEISMINQVLLPGPSAPQQVLARLRTCVWRQGTIGAPHHDFFFCHGVLGPWRATALSEGPLLNGGNPMTRLSILHAISF